MVGATMNEDGVGRKMFWKIARSGLKPRPAWFGARMEYSVFGGNGFRGLPSGPMERIGMSPDLLVLRVAQYT